MASRFFLAALLAFTLVSTSAADEEIVQIGDQRVTLVRPLQTAGRQWRCGQYIEVHELQPQMLGGIHLRGGTIFRLEGPLQRQVGLLASFLDKLNDSVEPSGEFESFGSDERINGDEQPKQGSGGEGTTVEGREALAEAEFEQGEERVAVQQPGSEGSDDVDGSQDPMAQALREWVERQERKEIRFPFALPPFFPRPLGVFRPFLLDFDQFFEIRARALQRMHEALLQQNSATGQSENVEYVNPFSTDGNSDVVDKGAVEEEADEQSDIHRMFKGLMPGTYGESVEEDPVAGGDEEEPAGMVTSEAWSQMEQPEVARMMEERISQSGEEEVAFPLEVMSGQPHLADVMGYMRTAPLATALGCVLAGLLVSLSFALLFAIAGLVFHQRTEERRGGMVLDAPDPRTPLLQTYTVNYTTREGNAAEDTEGSDSDAEKCVVVVYQPPEVPNSPKQ